MRQLIKIGAIALLLAAGDVTNSDAQIVVRVRPNRPSVVVTNRPPQPTPRHVWVDEDWRARGRRYNWHGGYWTAPPRRYPNAAWVPGHWESRRGGNVWVGGHWRY